MTVLLAVLSTANVNPEVFPVCRVLQILVPSIDKEPWVYSPIVLVLTRTKFKVPGVWDIIFIKSIGYALTVNR